MDELINTHSINWFAKFLLIEFPRLFHFFTKQQMASSSDLFVKRTRQWLYKICMISNIWKKTQLHCLFMKTRAVDNNLLLFDFFTLFKYSTHDNIIFFF
jgi:hypothetical protein